MRVSVYEHAAVRTGESVCLDVYVCDCIVTAIAAKFDDYLYMLAVRRRAYFTIEGRRVVTANELRISGTQVFTPSLARCSV